VNANSDPLDTTLEPNRGALAPFATLPSYVTTYQPTTRFERLAELLRADSRVSLEAAKRYATDTEVPAARQVLAALQRAATQATPEERAPAQEALGVLARWNRRADVESVGCGLYYYWLRGESSAVALARKAKASVAWSGAESAEALKTLGQAATRFRERFGRLDAPWSEVHVMQRGAETAGFLGFGLAEFVSVMPAYGSFAQGRALINTGSSFRMIVHLNPKGVESWSVLPFGVSQDPANPHYADQMHLFRVGRYKETRFGVPNARRYAVATQTLKTSGKE
jgi:acyl-homoserine-lactone acylase